jgi:RHS repeat-associated protein
VLDVATGMNYMQQRYYDPGVGRFLSRDPVTANTKTGANFNAYWYANNNPYKFTDPDGRRACGKDWDCRVTQHNGGTSFSRGELSAAKKNPEAFVNRLNSRSNSQRTEGGSARYFARSAAPVTIATGREVGADIVNTGAGGKPFSVMNFALGDTAGVEQSSTYAGVGTRVAIAHTHTRNQPFSGINAVLYQGKGYGGFAVESDMYKARDAGVSSYVGTPNGMLLKFDMPQMNQDARANPDAYLRASDYVSEVP